MMGLIWEITDMVAERKGYLWLEFREQCGKNHK